MTLPSFNYYKNLIFTLLLIFSGTSSLLNASTLTVTVTDRSGTLKKNLYVQSTSKEGINHIIYSDENGKSKFEELEDGIYIIEVKEFNRVMRFKVRVEGITDQQLQLRW